MRGPKRCWDATVYTENCERLIGSDIAPKFTVRVLCILLMAAD